MQTAAYINEINIYSPEEEERGNFHCEQKRDILGHRNEAPIAEMQVAAPQCRYHYSKDALWSDRIPALPEKGLGDSIAKCSANGIHSAKDLSALHHKTQPKEINPQRSSAQQPEPPGKGVFQPKTGDKLQNFDPGNDPKQTLETSNGLRLEEEGFHTTPKPIVSIQCPLPEIPDKDRRFCNPSFLPEDTRVEMLRAVGRENPSNHLGPISRQAEDTDTVHKWNPPGGGSDERDDGARRTSPFNVSFEDPRARGMKGELAWEGRGDGLTKVNGELEEDDAEVAEALAALEAATAGEIFEEEEEEY